MSTYKIYKKLESWYNPEQLNEDNNHNELEVIYQEELLFTVVEDVTAADGDTVIDSKEKILKTITDNKRSVPEAMVERFLKNTLTALKATSLLKSDTPIEAISKGSESLRKKHINNSGSGTKAKSMSFSALYYSARTFFITKRKIANGFGSWVKEKLAGKEATLDE